MALTIYRLNGIVKIFVHRKMELAVVLCWLVVRAFRKVDTACKKAKVLLAASKNSKDVPLQFD